MYTMTTHRIFSITDSKKLTFLINYSRENVWDMESVFTKTYMKMYEIFIYYII